MLTHVFKSPDLKGLVHGAKPDKTPICLFEQKLFLFVLRLTILPLYSAGF